VTDMSRPGQGQPRPPAPPGPPGTDIAVCRLDHHLKSGGLYMIEYWGTGNWNDWPDGRCDLTGRSSGRC
jgi:hypothetical protein